MLTFDPTISAGAVFSGLSFLLGAGIVWIRIETKLVEHSLKLGDHDRRIGALESPPELVYNHLDK